jgi:hypothetical protein
MTRRPEDKSTPDHERIRLAREHRLKMLKKDLAGPYYSTTAVDVTELQEKSVREILRDFKLAASKPTTVH